MTKIDLTAFANTDNTNKGICREWAVCRYFGIERNVHDSKNYMENSDVELDNGMNISLKASAFSLYNGTLTKGCKTFEGIWRRYYKNCHSNTWGYITKDWQCYLMNKKEFSQFVHRFCHLGHESSSKGGGLKIRMNNESGTTIKWLEERVA